MTRHPSVGSDLSLPTCDRWQGSPKKEATLSCNKLVLLYQVGCDLREVYAYKIDRGCRYQWM